MPYLDTALAAARAAGAKLRAAVGDDHTVNEASAHDIKLQMDVDCQNLITEHLLAAHPETSVFGEEGGVPLGDTEFQWIVDPIDGTVNFFFGFPHFCTTLALQQNGQTILGVTYDPIRDEMFHAERGQGAFRNGKRIRVSPRARLEDCIVSTGFAKSKDYVTSGMERFTHLAMNALKVRMNGCAALDLAYVACGRLDAYVEQGIRLWDIAAGALLIEEAGGRMDLTDLPGKAVAYRMVASNGQVPIPRWE